jgi:hypothetical protein
MTSKRRLAPSRIRYAAANPAHTVRLKPKTHAKVVSICERTGLSYNQAVNSAVDGFDEAALDAAFARGQEVGFNKGVMATRAGAHATGFAAAATLFRLTVPCYHCGQPIELRLDDSSARLAIGLLISAGLAHTPCVEAARHARNARDADVR